VPEYIERLVAERTGIEWTAYKQREVIGQQRQGRLAVAPGQGEDRSAVDLQITSPATSDAKQWEGWGTALKPAFEPVVVGRKPFGKGVTVAENVLLWGVGGLNIDGSRIGSESRVNQKSSSLGNGHTMSGGKAQDDYPDIHVTGRWPANVIFDEVTAGLLDEQSGETPSKFFYQAKASKRDRNEGLEELALRQATGGGGGIGDYLEDVNSASGKYGSEKAPAKNFHPTVKPTALMRYLIKLVTPPGGTVLDPFTGSGSTGKAALLDGFQFVGVELTEEYLPIIEGRLRWAAEQEGEDDDTLF
jgi:site-specific DNA-methyltransferase (adenine-specific)